MTAAYSASSQHVHISLYANTCVVQLSSVNTDSLTVLHCGLRPKETLFSPIYLFKSHNTVYYAVFMQYIVPVPYCSKNSIVLGHLSNTK